MFTLNGELEETIKLFKPFELTEYEARVYLTLQLCGKTKASELWKKAGIPQSKIYQIIPQLQMKQLIEITKLFPKEVKAKSILRFANDYLTERKCLLEEIEEKIKEYKQVVKRADKFGL